MLNEEKIAYYLYRSVGVSNDSLSDSTVVSVLNDVVGGVGYTEEYFYEEMLYSMYFIYEAEWRFGYINLIRDELRSKDRIITEDQNLSKLGEAFANYVYYLSCARMKLAGVSQTWSQERVIELNNARGAEYSELFRANVKCLDPLEEKPFDAFLPTNSRHPFDRYMLIISNNIYKSLGVSSELHHIIIYQILRGKWTSIMSVANKLGMSQ